MQDSPVLHGVLEKCHFAARLYCSDGHTGAGYGGWGVPGGVVGYLVRGGGAGYWVVGGGYPGMGAGGVLAGGVLAGGVLAVVYL